MWQLQFPNPWTEYSDIDEGEKKAGFSFDIPETIVGYKIGLIQNQDQSMIEVIYEAVDDSEDTIHIRKGSKTDDISGDYNSYSESKK